MSVFMTLRVHGDPQKLEQLAARDPSAMQAISARAQEHGVIAHRFYGSEDGQILVLDEWPDPESFQKFFDEVGPQIGPMMAEVGATGEQEVVFWRLLETNDAVGWGA
jgi:hypothetical protein